jgi:hypothetical protein
MIILVVKTGISNITIGWFLKGILVVFANIKISKGFLHKDFIILSPLLIIVINKTKVLFFQVINKI